jgi:glycosyltransferase involved in cell wall biosynthesis
MNNKIIGESLDRLPEISIVIPTYNEEKNIGTCLNALLKQKYSFDHLEIIIIDNVSTDRTFEIIKQYEKKFNISIIFNRIEKDAEVSKMLGLRKAKGKFCLYLDADIEVVGDGWLNQLVKPLLEDDTIVGSFPRFLPKPTDCSLGRYLRYHPLELDPIFQFFCVEIDKTIVDDKGDYKICKFNSLKMPPIGICIYRKELLMRAIGDMKKFMDIDMPVILSKKGYNKFAYVPSCGIYHVNVRSLKDLIKKRLRNIDKVFLPNLMSREYRYFNLRNRQDIFKIMVWVIYANLFIPKTIKGILLTIKNRDIACMYEPIVSMLLTDAIIYAFIRDKRGREIISNNIFREF